ncbi:MAG: polysaccharide deacetylase family protein [Longimicrobiales bacterium]
MSGLVYLMYHEIAGAGEATARSDGGYLRYVIRSGTFDKQLDAIRAAGLRAIAAGTAVEARNDVHGAVVLTFDDGCASDLLVAAPRLAERGWSATFYVTVEHVGRPAFLTAPQVRALADQGFEVGSHAYSHTYLTRLDAAALRSQMCDSRAWLEDTIGREVRHLSCPGGRWSPAVAAAAGECGFHSVAVSRPVPNGKGADLFRLGRFAVTATMDHRAFGHVLHGRLPLAGRWKEQMTSVSRSLLGDRRYDALRDRVLGR